jgi:hypothetical protein
VTDRQAGKKKAAESEADSLNATTAFTTVQPAEAHPDHIEISSGLQAFSGVSLTCTLPLAQPLPPSAAFYKHKAQLFLNCP